MGGVHSRREPELVQLDLAGLDQPVAVAVRPSVVLEDRGHRVREEGVGIAAEGARVARIGGPQERLVPGVEGVGEAHPG